MSATETRVPLDLEAAVRALQPDGWNGARTMALTGSDEEPSWLPPTLERLRALVALPENWNSYGAPPIQADAAVSALRLLARVLLPGSPLPAIVPTARAGVQLEWHQRGVDLEIDTSLPGQYAVYYLNHHTGEEWERDLTTDLSPLEGPIAVLAGGG